MGPAADLSWLRGVLEDENGNRSFRGHGLRVGTPPEPGLFEVWLPYPSILRKLLILFRNEVV